MTSVQSPPAAPQLNGHQSYGANIKDALIQEERIEKSAVQNLSKEHDIVLKTFRLLIADLCEQFAAGHPGYVPSLSCQRKEGPNKVAVVLLVWQRLVLHSGSIP